MARTALLWVIAFGTGVVLSFRDPFFGVLLYLLDYYEHPPLRWWGKNLPDLRWSLLASVILLVSYLARGGSLFDARILRHRQTLWLLAFLGVVLMVTPIGVSPESGEYVGRVAKLVLLFFLMVGTTRAPSHYRLFVVAMVVGGALWGLDALDEHRSGGRLRGVGGPDSFEDNSTAAHLVATLPFIGFCVWRGARWEKVLAVAAAPLVLNTIVLCNSRGATLGIVTMALAALVLAKGRVRFTVAAGLLVGGLVFWSLMDTSFRERQSTLADARDTSAMNRVESWKGALELIGDYPLGAGGGGFEFLSRQYISEIVEDRGGQGRSVHNTYLLAAADWGVLGLVCLLAFIGSAVWDLDRIRRESRGSDESVQALVLQLAFVGFMTTALFTNRLYAEMLYWLVALAAALRNIRDERAAAALGGESEGADRHGAGLPARSGVHA